MATVEDFYDAARSVTYYKPRRPCKVALALQEYEARGDSKGKKALEGVLKKDDLNGGAIVKILQRDGIKAMQSVKVHTPVTNHRKQKCACFGGTPRRPTADK